MAEQATQDLNRREFLSVAWLASLGIFAMQSGVVSYRVLAAPGEATAADARIALGAIENLPPVEAAPLRAGRGLFYWLQTDAGALALSCACTHLGCLFDWKPMDGQFICPCHGAFFDTSGTFLKGPETQWLSRYRNTRVTDPYQRPWPAALPATGIAGQRGADRFVIIAEDAAGREVARTPPDGGPVQIPPGARVFVDTSAVILGPPADEGM